MTASEVRERYVRVRVHANMYRAGYDVVLASPLGYIVEAKYHDHPKDAESYADDLAQILAEIIEDATP